jgi:hypothetical protein
VALAARGTVDPVGEFLSRASYSEKPRRGRAMKRGRIPDSKIGDTPVSCRKDSRGDFVTMADAIESLIACHSGLTAAQISQMLFTNKCEAERVELICRRLIAEGRLKRSGTGTIANPFSYAPKRHSGPETRRSRLETLTAERP